MDLMGLMHSLKYRNAVVAVVDRQRIGSEGCRLMMGSCMRRPVDRAKLCSLRMSVISIRG